jgi:hypothetical protein
MRLESIAAPVLPIRSSEDLVQIAAAQGPADSPGERRSWSELSLEDQRLHLQAQRAVRVRVANMRLENPDAVRRGTFAGNIYRELCTQIDSARTEFLQTYLSKSPTMVDYLHLEILRSLAHDDDRLLGPDYPGPMV